MTYSLEELRSSYPVFIYHSFGWKKDKTNRRLIFDFVFSSGDIFFKPKITFVFDKGATLISLENDVLDNLAFHLGLVEIPSYWKAFCSPKIEVKAGFLNQRQIAFWEKLLIFGLGEFYYVNKIDFTQKNFVKIFSKSSRTFKKNSKHVLKDAFIVPIGGGKDSCVSLNVLSSTNFPVVTFSINPSKAAKKIVRLSNFSRFIEVERKIDTKLLELNSLGFLNGHTPFTSVVNFQSASAALITESKYVATSSESSANEGNVIFLGRNINHQYAKTFEFEKGFFSYVRSYIHPKLYCFSLLRPLNELQISQAFSRLDKYIPHFLSCNRGVKENKWCKNCPKCFSTYLLLLPFVDNSLILKIFGKKLHEIPSNKKLLESLKGESGIKPFECVATPDEINAALDIVEKRKNKFRKVISVLRDFNEEHLVPKFLLDKVEVLRNPLTYPLIPISRILILGFGVEGKSTFKFLIKRFKNLDIVIADANPKIKDEVKKISAKTKLHKAAVVVGEKYLDTLRECDMVFKSPGISHNIDQIKNLNKKYPFITSNTKLFFEASKGRIIGVTGTKGKSTTTSLIYHVLKQNKIPVEIIGNIGKPALDYLKSDSRDKIYCFELSSHQLFDMTQSPNIAIIQRIYPDHLDYYKSFSEYREAKTNIFMHQSRCDYAVLNKLDEFLVKESKKIVSKIIYFDSSLPDIMKRKDNPLIGDFNFQNIWPSVIVGRIFGISDKRIIATIKGFQPLESRLELVGEYKKIKFYSDMRSTIPEVTCAAIDALGSYDSCKVETILLGGQERSQDYTKLIPYLEGSKIKYAILFPSTGVRIDKVIKDNNILRRKIRTFLVSSMREAIEIVYKYTSSQSICLMSTAAPSYGIFKSGEDKAEQFNFWAKKLGRVSG